MITRLLEANTHFITMRHIEFKIEKLRLSPFFSVFFSLNLSVCTCLFNGIMKRVFMCSNLTLIIAERVYSISECLYS